MPPCTRPRRGAATGLALFAPFLAEAVAVQHRMEQGLRRALENQELSLHWQPMVDMRDGSLRGAEVLLRWHHPELGQVPPNSFIPLAETTGMICPIGSWVLDQACEQVAAWRQQGLLLPRVAINVSVRQFEQEDILHRVRRTLQRCGIAPEQLEIEVTESLFATAWRCARCWPACVISACASPWTISAPAFPRWAS